MFVSRAKPRRHLRCALCGRLHTFKPEQSLPAQIRSDHIIQVLKQDFVGGANGGGGKGFEWSFQDLTLEELLALDEVVSAVARRVRKMIVKATGEDDGEE